MKNFKKILAIVLSVLFVASVTVVGVSAASNEKAWYNAAVNYLDDIGIASIGTTAGEELSRDEFVTWVAKLESHQLVESAWTYHEFIALSTFTDVADSDHKGAIGYSVGREFIVGNGDGTFTPHATVTLGQAAAVIVRLMDYTSKVTGETWTEQIYNYMFVANTFCGAFDETFLARTSIYDPDHKLTKGEGAWLLYTIMNGKYHTGDADATVRYTNYGVDLGAYFATNTTATVKAQFVVSNIPFVYTNTTQSFRRYDAYVTGGTYESLFADKLFQTNGLIDKTGTVTLQNIASGNQLTMTASAFATLVKTAAGTKNDTTDAMNYIEQGSVVTIAVAKGDRDILANDRDVDLANTSKISNFTINDSLTSDSYIGYATTTLANVKTGAQPLGWKFLGATASASSTFTRLTSTPVTWTDVKFSNGKATAGSIVVDGETYKVVTSYTGAANEIKVFAPTDIFENNKLITSKTVVSVVGRVGDTVYAGGEFSESQKAILLAHGDYAANFDGTTVTTTFTLTEAIPSWVSYELEVEGGAFVTNTSFNLISEFVKDGRLDENTIDITRPLSVEEARQLILAPAQGECNVVFSDTDGDGAYDIAIVTESSRALYYGEINSSTDPANEGYLGGNTSWTREVYDSFGNYIMAVQGLKGHNIGGLVVDKTVAFGGTTGGGTDGWNLTSTAKTNKVQLVVTMSNERQIYGGNNDTALYGVSNVFPYKTVDVAALTTGYIESVSATTKTVGGQKCYVASVINTDGERTTVYIPVNPSNEITLTVTVDGVASDVTFGAGKSLLSFVTDHETGDEIGRVANGAWMAGHTVKYVAYENGVAWCMIDTAEVGAVKGFVTGVEKSKTGDNTYKVTVVASTTEASTSISYPATAERVKSAITYGYGSAMVVNSFGIDALFAEAGDMTVKAYVVTQAAINQFTTLTNSNIFQGISGNAPLTGMYFDYNGDGKADTPTATPLFDANVTYYKGDKIKNLDPYVTYYTKGSDGKYNLVDSSATFDSKETYYVKTTDDKGNDVYTEATDADFHFTYTQVDQTTESFKTDTAYYVVAKYTFNAAKEYNSAREFYTAETKDGNTTYTKATEFKAGTEYFTAKKDGTTTVYTAATPEEVKDYKAVYALVNDKPILVGTGYVTNSTFDKAGIIISTYDYITYVRPQYQNSTYFTETSFDAHDLFGYINWTKQGSLMTMYATTYIGGSVKPLEVKGSATAVWTYDADTYALVNSVLVGGKLDRHNTVNGEVITSEDLIYLSFTKDAGSYYTIDGLDAASYEKNVATGETDWGAIYMGNSANYFNGDHLSSNYRSRACFGYRYDLGTTGAGHTSMWKDGFEQDFNNAYILGYELADENEYPTEDSYGTQDGYYQLYNMLVGYGPYYVRNVDNNGKVTYTLYFTTVEELEGVKGYFYYKVDTASTLLVALINQSTMKQEVASSADAKQFYATYTVDGHKCYVDDKTNLVYTIWGDVRYTTDLVTENADYDESSATLKVLSVTINGFADGTGYYTYDGTDYNDATTYDKDETYYVYKGGSYVEATEEDFDTTTTYAVYENQTLAQINERIVDEITEADLVTIEAYPFVEGENGYVPGLYHVDIKSGLSSVNNYQMTLNSKIVVVTPDSKAGDFTITVTTAKELYEKKTTVFAVSYQADLGGNTCTMLSAIGSLSKTTTSTPVDPGTTIPSDITEGTTLVYLNASAGVIAESIELGNYWVIRSTDSAIDVTTGEEVGAIQYIFNTYLEKDMTSAQTALEAGGFFLINSDNEVLTIVTTDEGQSGDTKTGSAVVKAGTLTSVTADGKTIATMDGKKDVDISKETFKFIYFDMDNDRFGIGGSSTNVAIATESEIKGTYSSYEDIIAEGANKAPHYYTSDDITAAAESLASAKEAVVASYLDGTFWNVEFSPAYNYFVSQRVSYQNKGTVTLNFNYIVIDGVYYVFVNTFTK